MRPRSHVERLTGEYIILDKINGEYHQIGAKNDTLSQKFGFDTILDFTQNQLAAGEEWLRIY